MICVYDFMSGFLSPCTSSKTFRGVLGSTDSCNHDFSPCFNQTPRGDINLNDTVPARSADPSDPSDPSVPLSWPRYIYISVLSGTRLHLVADSLMLRRSHAVHFIALCWRFPFFHYAFVFSLKFSGKSSAAAACHIYSAFPAFSYALFLNFFFNYRCLCFCTGYSRNFKRGISD